MFTEISQTIIEMMEDRDYAYLKNEIFENIAYQVFKHKNFETLKQKPGFFEHIYICTEIYPKITVQVFKDHLQNISKFTMQHLILIYREDLTYNVKEIIRQKSNDLVIETFSENELKFNVSRHFLQPKFKLLNSLDRQKIIKKFGIGIPIIKKSDPVSRYYNWPENSIIKIDQGDNREFYRIVKG